MYTKAVIYFQITCMKNPLSTLINQMSAKKQDQEISNLKEDFLSLATHELRSPLTTVLWTLDLLLKNLNTHTPETLKPKLETMQRNAQHMNELINNILTATRIRDGAVREQNKPTHIPELIQSAIDDVKKEADEKHITLALKVVNETDFEKEYQVNVNLFTQCLNNLLTNAIRFNHEYGKVEVTLATKGKDMCITIADTGIGILDADMPRIFEEFYKGQNIPQNNQPSSGLGLFVVKSVIDKWQGKITITSKENEGTSVEFCLPLTTT